MEQAENKKQELQEFAREMENEKETLMERAINEMCYIYKIVMSKQEKLMKDNMSSFHDLATVMFDNQKKQMEEFKNILDVALHRQNEMFEHYLIDLRETNEIWYEEMKVLRLEFVENLRKLNAESTKLG